MAGRSDNLMDFFNVKKPFPKIHFPGPPPRTCAAFDPLSVPPPATSSSGRAGHAEREWREYRAGVNRQLQEAAAGSVHGSVAGRGTVVRSDMSGIEGDTVVGTMSVAPHSEGRDGRDLTKCFDFTKQPEEAWKLPIAESKATILDTVAAHQIVVISGPTGCGKSTQVPQFLLDQHAAEGRAVNILVTQPRKIAASSVARRVCQERGWTLGGLVGYQVGLDRVNKSPDTRLIYVTTGILKRLLIAKKHMNDWTHVILDEVHEREEDMDLVMLICKKLLLTNSRGTKLILMSATMDQMRFRSYFAALRPGLQEPQLAPLVSLSQRQGPPVQEYYWDQLQPLLVQRYPALPTDDPRDFDDGNPMLSERAVKMCRALIEKLDDLEEQEKRGGAARRLPGAVLVFLPGLHEIKVVRDALMAEDGGGLERRRGPEWRCIALHSSVPWEEHDAIFPSLGPNQRKIILSTNIAESSITIPDIRYVIDFCLTKNNVADPETNYPRLVLVWASQSQMTQRKGRAGRVDHDGRVYRLLPEAFCRDLPQDHRPEMQRVPLTKVVLDVKILGLGSPKELLALAMDPPELRSVQRTVLALKEMGALLATVGGGQSREDGDLTVLGEVVARLPVDVRLGKLIVLGHVFNVLEEAVIIASGLNGKSIFTSPFDKRVQAYKNKLHWADRTFSDCFAILLAFQTWDRHCRKGDFSGRDGVAGREADWCRASFLQRKQLVEMRTLVEEITRSLKMIDIEPLQIQDPIHWEPEYKFLILRLIMFGAFYPNYFVKVSSHKLEKLAHKTLCGRDPKNTVYLHGFDKDQAQFGELYVDQVKRLFRAATEDEDRISLTFSGAHIFVEFDRPLQDQDRSMASYRAGREDRNVTGDISSQVYVSVKLRQGGGRDQQAVRVYNQEVAERKHEEWRRALVQQTAGAELTSELVEQVAPPDMAAAELVMEPVYVSSPSVFWIQFGERCEAAAERLQEMMAGWVGRLERAGQVHRGELYIAPFTDQGEEEPCYYRARVNSVQGDKVTVFFIDYGNMACLPAQELLVISPLLVREHPDMVRTPGLALECRLARLQPSRIKNSKGLWDKQAVERFRDLVTQGGQEGRLIGKIFSVTKSGSGHSKFVVALESLTIKSHMAEEVDIREVLLREHHAEPAVESYISQQNHEDRQNHRAYQSALQRHLDNYARYDTKSAIGLRPPQETSKLVVKATMTGPFSPLEHKVQCLHRHGATKMVNVDPESVNSVMLDQSPGDHYDHYLVAAHVGMNPSGEMLQLRNTTWLPARPGLGAFATMMFSPRVEMRTNTTRTRITGCLSGLGPRTDWDKPAAQVTAVERTEAFYPEHDVETRFDVNVTNEDVNTVNKIRYWMNQCLSKTPDQMVRLTQPIALDRAQKGLKRHLEDLFNRERRLEDKEPQPAGRDYRWNLLEKGHRYGSKNVDNEEDHIFKMTDGVRLGPSVDRLMGQLVELWGRAKQGDTRLLAEADTCPACPGQVELKSLHEMFSHLRTEQHRAVEAELQLQDRRAAD